MAPRLREKATLLHAKDIERMLTRISHEIVERNSGTEALAIVGIHSRGVPLAHRIAQKIKKSEGVDPPLGALDVNLYRDDVSLRPHPPLHRTELNFSLDGMTIVLVDDVLYTGRTIRAALDALMDFGRPLKVQLAVLVDRGHRELPIRADFVGKSVPTAKREQIQVHIAEIDGDDRVAIVEEDEEPAANERAGSDDGRRG